MTSSSYLISVPIIKRVELTPQTLWQQIIFDTMPRGTLVEAMQKAVADLEMLVERPFYIPHIQVKLIPCNELRTYDDPLFTVGIFLHMSNDLPGWAVLTLPMAKACKLVDCLLEKPCGTTDDLDPLACSALAEVGNVLLTSFLSQLSQFTGTSIRPSPPSVVVDRLNNILEISAASLTIMADELLVIETDIKNAEKDLQIRVWVLPDRFAFQFDHKEVQQNSKELVGADAW